MGVVRGAGVGGKGEAVVIYREDEISSSVDLKER